ncbi:hypothetical protein BB341_13355 [Streptomyces clavuligerus]|nr:hypothetical protein BB341_13355 [Streptomyces clavuligerus]AXU13718.1 HNH endonuclease [Streptomyces clavuligerus]
MKKGPEPYNTGGPERYQAVMNRHPRRTVAALSFCLALVPVALAGSVRAAPAQPPAEPVVMQLEDAISLLVEVEEDRTGFSPTAFPHWNEGRDPADGCTTENEVLRTEAVDEPAVSGSCALSGGRWVSYYDNQSTTQLSSLAVDHVVPLADAWASGASAWTAERREAYANDQDSPYTLAAVTRRTVQEKAGRDISGWQPAETGPLCRYAGDWVGTKLRWGLSTDKAELEALKMFADNMCETTVVRHLPGPAQ